MAGNNDSDKVTLSDIFRALDVTCVEEMDPEFMRVWLGGTIEDDDQGISSVCVPENLPKNLYDASPFHVKAKVMHSSGLSIRKADPERLLWNNVNIKDLKLPRRVVEEMQRNADFNDHMMRLLYHAQKPRMLEHLCVLNGGADITCLSCAKNKADGFVNSVTTKFFGYSNKTGVLGLQFDFLMAYPVCKEMHCINELRRERDHDAEKQIPSGETGREQCHCCGAFESSSNPHHGCGKCKHAFYCSKACQKSHWSKGHKEECNAYCKKAAAAKKK